jgi:hypothetical protein
MNGLLDLLTGCGHDFNNKRTSYQCTSNSKKKSYLENGFRSVKTSEGK